MRYANDIYIADGNTVTFQVTFPYLSRLHVAVTVNGWQAYNGADYVWTSAGSIAFFEPPEGGVIVNIIRNTHLSGPLMDFQNTAMLTAGDLNTATFQAIYLCQELADQIAGIRDDLIPPPPAVGGGWKYTDMLLPAGSEIIWGYNVDMEIIRLYSGGPCSIRQIAGARKGSIKVLVFDADDITMVHTGVPSGEQGYQILLQGSTSATFGSGDILVLLNLEGEQVEPRNDGYWREIFRSLYN